MAEFVLDTSGAVYGQSPQWDGTCVLWSGLSPFCQGYVEAMLRGLWDDKDAIAAGPGIERYAGFSDLSPAALELILKDCENIASWLSDLTREDGRRIWEHRQEGFPGPGPIDDRLAANLPPLRPVLSDEGKVDLQPE